MSSSVNIKEENKVDVAASEMKPLLSKCIFISGRSCRRLSEMQAAVPREDMCGCSCAYSNKLSLCLQQVRTGDLGGYATSNEFTQAVIANLVV